jgi:L-rhamnose isomerase
METSPPKAIEIIVSFLTAFKSLGLFHFSLTKDACKNKL